MFLTNRGMKAVLLLRPSVSLYSTDALPANCSAFADTTKEVSASSSRPSAQAPRTCDCLTQTLLCHGCGASVGYTIVQPCIRCTQSTSASNRSTNGHRFVFHAAEIVACERRHVPGEPGVVPAPLAPSQSAPSSLREHYARAAAFSDAYSLRVVDSLPTGSYHTRPGAHAVPSPALQRTLTNDSSSDDGTDSEGDVSPIDERGYGRPHPILVGHAAMNARAQQQQQQQQPQSTSPTGTPSPPASPSRLAREREQRAREAREAAEVAYARDMLYARAGIVPPPMHHQPLAQMPPPPSSQHHPHHHHHHPRGRDVLATHYPGLLFEEDKREPPRLEAGEPVFWHHLTRGGEMPGVYEDKRARASAVATAAPRARLQR